MPRIDASLPTRLLKTGSFRLAMVYAGLFGLSVCVLFVVIYVLTGRYAWHQIEDAVVPELNNLAVVAERDGITVVAHRIDERLASPLGRTMGYLLLDPAGRRLAGNLPSVRPFSGWRSLPINDHTGRGHGIVDANGDGDPDHASIRSVEALGTILPGGSFLLVGQDTHALHEVREMAAKALAWGTVATVLLALIGGVVMSAAALRRVEAINRISRAIMLGDLSRRIPLTGSGDDFDTLAANLNAMLDRIQLLMESMRQVSDDIAHDLRTPLSRLRQHLEGARRKARTVEEYEALVERAIADADGLLETFAALLRIAQIEASARRVAFAPVDLSDVCQTLVEVYGPVAEDRSQTLTGAIAPGVTVRGDRELITQMLANLVENALTHCPAGATVAVSLAAPGRADGAGGHAGGGPVAIVADNGPGIPEEDRQRVFRRFFRLDRSRSTPGNGLGLSLVAAVAALHGVQISLEDNHPGLKVTARFAAA